MGLRALYLLRLIFAVWVTFNFVFSATPNIKNGPQAGLLEYRGFAKTSLGQPADGAIYQVRATKIPPDITRTISPDTGGLYSIDASEIGQFNVGDTIIAHLYNGYRPQDSSNTVHVVTPEDTLELWQYLPQIYCDSSLVPNRAYAISIRNVFSPVNTRKFVEFYLRKDPYNRDTVFGPQYNSADTFHFNLEHLPQPANDGDTVYMHIGLFNIVGNDTIFNDTIYLDTFAVVKRWIGRFPNDADRPIDTAWLRVHIPHDVGTLRIVAPVGVIDSGTAVTPQVWIKNYGHRSETFSARFRIGAVYDRRVTGSTLRPGSL